MKTNKLLTRVFQSASMVIAMIALAGCSAFRTTPVVTQDAPVRIQSVLVIPKQSLNACEPLGQLDGTKSGAVTDWMIKAHGIHSSCMNQQQMMAALIRLADEEKALIKIHTTNNNNKGDS